MVVRDKRNELQEYPKWVVGNYREQKSRAQIKDDAIHSLKEIRE